jgi:NAD(P)-dependent dehydrogenase (short-subunit alcohol dehydrogenase family)
MSPSRTAIVTGASSGFGRLTAQALAADGWRVYATMRDVAGRNAVSAVGLRAEGIAVVELDVLSDTSVAAAAFTIGKEVGAPDVLVNNAGNAFFGLVEAFTPAAVEQQFATNVVGPLRVNRAFLPAMRARKTGLIVYVSSIVGRLVIPSGGVYGASKFALEALAEASSYELAPFGIDVAIVQPGAYPTDISAKGSGADDAARAESYGDLDAIIGGAIDAALGGVAKTRDSADVARAIVALANAPAGTRPLRTTVPADPATDAINAATAPVQAQVIEALGLGDLLPKALAR